VVLIATGFLGGCSDKYGHKPLGSDSPEAQQVRAMTEELRADGMDRLKDIANSQALEELTDQQLERLHLGLEKLVVADGAELQKIEKFGPDIYRAVFTVEIGSDSEPLAMLLGTSGGKLRWIGRN